MDDLKWFDLFKYVLSYKMYLSYLIVFSSSHDGNADSADAQKTATGENWEHGVNADHLHDGVHFNHFWFINISAQVVLVELLGDSHDNPNDLENESTASNETNENIVDQTE